TTTATTNSAVGSYDVTCTAGTLAAANYSFSFTTDKLTVTQEDARAYYTGHLLVFTSSTTSSTATVALSATIKDITAVTGDPAYDASAGDSRNAKVKFVNRDTGATLCDNLSVGLVSASDTKVGTAT